VGKILFVNVTLQYCPDIRSEMTLSRSARSASVSIIVNATSLLADGHNQLPKLVLGVTFADGIEVIAKPTDRQPTTAAA
jgi:putative transposase